MKKLSFILITAIALVVFAGCAPAEEEVKVPVGKPGDGGPQPSPVQSAGGGTAPATTPKAEAPATE